MYERILIAIDATPQGQRVTEHTRELARLTGAAVYVLHVGEPELYAVDAPGATASVRTNPETAPARKLMEATLAFLGAAGVPAEGEIQWLPHDQVPQAIRERARERRAQLVVLGVRHHSRLAGLFRRRVADEMAHHPPCPILLVP